MDWRNEGWVGALHNRGRWFAGQGKVRSRDFMVWELVFVHDMGEAWADL